MSEIDTFDAIIDLFHVRMGIVYPISRRADAILGIRQAMAQAGIASSAEFLKRISDDKESFARLIEHLAIGETYFFREIAQFNEIRNRIVPDLRALRGPNCGLRAWSAGCSTGEEAYSLAILFEQESIPAHILATDISPKALAKAKLGNYGAWSLRGEGRQAATYIDAQNPRLVIPDRFRARIDFRSLNLVADSYPSPATLTTNLDLILCRNVLIYFDETSIREVARRLSGCLAPGGWLITGPSDPPLWHDIDLEPVITPGGVFYHRRAQPIAPRVQPQDRHAAPSSYKQARPLKPRGAAQRPSHSHASVPHSSAKTGTDVDHASTVDHIRSLADRGNLADAIAASEAAIARHPTQPVFHYLRSIALLAQGHLDEALEALRRVIYLDRSLAVAQFSMGILLSKRGDLSKARRAFQRAYLLCSSRPADEILPLGDGERAKDLAAAARARLESPDRGTDITETANGR